MAAKVFVKSLSCIAFAHTQQMLNQIVAVLIVHTIQYVLHDLINKCDGGHGDGDGDDDGEVLGMPMAMAMAMVMVMAMVMAMAMAMAMVYFGNETIETIFIHERHAFLQDTESVLIDGESVTMFTGGIRYELKIFQRNVFQHGVDDV